MYSLLRPAAAARRFSTRSLPSQISTSISSTQRVPVPSVPITQTLSSRLFHTSRAQKKMDTTSTSSKADPATGCSSSTSPVPGITSSTTNPTASVADDTTTTSTPHRPTQFGPEEVNDDPLADPLSVEHQKLENNNNPLPLPSPETATPVSPDQQPKVVTVNGQAVALDNLGPMVVHKDGTISRIANWPEMTEIERENTLRILGKRNQLRLTNLREGRVNGEGM
ncbi:hypothetical protein NEUTE1DRAFT_66131 [Neurospora tetrasperma FGSC 2508]|uniref:Uncharacterized protein n=1 Tax=Neurospora tetrasperma (strain FGSC 2508 / ATCC MYA-4615 / P0657) TaxID=510951 RepID=F8MPF1_NEUT8|nr:uncharacterized protein NEUTE1DRAFT_66131 [Neurospora tetrasperma FGSC 2508]EGO57110.1 hypothetical protein NEUTE1DRAFT_66131 [Neurospora tetrasperma FGSC 2508]EGZ69972.1 hypothetical protein NEUTE2DRAFT_91010 [Neurospora tetrasperma FGSC 2509]